MAAALFWFRRDLRLADNPALLTAQAAAGAEGVLPIFVIDPALWGPSGQPRRDYLMASLCELNASLAGRLHIAEGNPTSVIRDLALTVEASSVHVSADFGPYGSARDARVEATLAENDVAFVRTGSPYAVTPGRVMNKTGSPYSVFTPFSRAWAELGWRPPAGLPANPHWLSVDRPAKASPLASPEGDRSTRSPGSFRAAGEAAATARWRNFRDGALAQYAELRNNPGVAGTSGLSVHLKWGEIHPRTLLADLAEQRASTEPESSAYRSLTVFQSEVAWREFYADVLHHRPDTARNYLKPDFAAMQYDEPGTVFAAWQTGHTGFPLVDAGMRQLLAEGWMHNRVRMVVASFLVKDLHLDWRLGARHFMRHLLDADLASNQHGWQWTAGCGTDASPYYRVFNPVGQGQRFDAEGDYVRKYVPELAHLDGAAAHQPWAEPRGYERGYPQPIVDHAQERLEALRRYEALKAP